jgi:hypothetical protein
MARLEAVRELGIARLWDSETLDCKTLDRKTLYRKTWVPKSHKAPETATSRFGIADLLPAFVGIECRHSFGDFRRVGAEILLKDRSVMVDQESHHARIAVFGRIGDQCKAADHLAIDDVVVFAAFGEAAAGGG